MNFFLRIAIEAKEAGRWEEAVAAFQKALSLEADSTKAHAILGLILQLQGQFDTALAWLKRAVELEPTDADFWQYLAELYGERDEPAEAIPCWRRVLYLAPERVVALFGLGWALQQEGRLSEAEEQYLVAVRIQPESAKAQMRLGGLHQVHGDLGKAEAAYREALRLQPSSTLPYALLATLLRAQLPFADQSPMEEQLADHNLAKGRRARLLFALAHVLDSRGEYSSAANCLHQANAFTLELARGGYRYSPVEYELFVDGLLTAFNKGFFLRTADWGSDSRRPVFVFGLPRSGTTLIEQILASHAYVYGAGELRLARQVLEVIPAALARSEPPLLCVSHLDATATCHLADQHLGKLKELDGGRASRIVDKMPDNYMYLGLLAVLFPRATFVHCRRDLRDVAVSCWMTDFRNIRWANDPEHIVTRFQQYCRLMEHWRAVLPVHIHEVGYEETVNNLEGVARRLVTACGLDWDPACLEFHCTRRPVQTASVTQVRQPIYKRSVARWKNYEHELADLFARLPAD